LGHRLRNSFLDSINREQIKMIYEIHSGYSLDRVTEEMVDLAKKFNTIVTADFNGVLIKAKSDDVSGATVVRRLGLSDLKNQVVDLLVFIVSSEDDIAGTMTEQWEESIRIRVRRLNGRASHALKK
jgi:hypothetical protein